jgi:hypothetical protein
VRPLLAALSLLLLVVASPAFGAGVPMAAHKALYILSLDKARGDVIAARGTMGYEVQDACDAWAVRQRLDMLVTNAEGQTTEMISDYAVWESKNGKRMRFHMKQTTDGSITGQTDGDAVINEPGGAGVARYTQPRHMTRPLPPGTLFPMGHTAAILANAEAGKTMFHLPLFDGTSENGAEYSSIVVTHHYPPRKMAWPALSNLPSYQIQIAFYDISSLDLLPDYQSGIRYSENGVADSMTMDFGDFVMHAELKEFALQPKRC